MTRIPNCNDELLTLYLYQELTADENHSLEQHLTECASCRAVLAELRSSLAAAIIADRLSHRIPQSPALCLCRPSATWRNPEPSAWGFASRRQPG